MAHGDAREGKWRGNWRMEWVASTLDATSEHGVSSITTADAHSSAASSRLNWRPCRFKWTRPFRRKTKSGFRACAITFQTQSTNMVEDGLLSLWREKCLVLLSSINPLTPNDLYMSRTAPLTSKRCILYIYSTNVGTEYFKHTLYFPFFLFKMRFVS